jgi:hypothetical protein
LATARGPRGAPAPADFRVGRGAVLQGRAADLGLAVASRRRLQGRGCFSQNCVTTPASAGAGSSRWVRHGRGHDPGKEGGTGRGGRGFAKLRNDPAAGAGAHRWDRSGQVRRPGEARVQVVGGRDFCEIALRPRPPPGQTPPAGFGPDGSATRGRAGTGRGGRAFFCEIAQQPAAEGQNGAWRGVPAPADDFRVGRGADPQGRAGLGAGHDGHTVFWKSRCDPRRLSASGRLRVCLAHVP